MGEREVAFPTVGPKLSATPARSDWAGRDLGADTREVLGRRLGLSGRELEELEEAGVIGTSQGRE